MTDAPFVGLDLDDLRPEPKALKFRGQELLLPPAVPILTIMESVAMQEKLRASVAEIQEMSPRSRAAGIEYEDAATAYREAIEAEYENDAEREKVIKPLEEAFEAAQQSYVGVMTEMAAKEAEQVSLNGKLLDMVMELIRDVPGQEDVPDLRVSPDEAFQIMAYVGGTQPGNMLDDAVGEAITGGELEQPEPDPTTPQPKAGETTPDEPPKPSARKKRSTRSRAPSPAPSSN